MKTRRAQVGDAPILARLHVDSWRAAYRDLVPGAYLDRFTYEFREERFRQALAEGTEETYFLEVHDQPVGILTFGAARDSDLDVSRTGEIWGIYVAPNWWRKGVGREAVAQAESILVLRGFETIVLWVLAENHSAREFYAAVGYAPDGALKQVNWGTPLKAMRYRKAV